MEKGKIYCLVRGGQERLAATLQYYFGDTYSNEIGRRIIAVDGDITKPNLADNLPDDIQTVIHTAATVKHYGSYDYFYGVNVQGTQNVIAFAKQTGAKLIHISTLSVSGNMVINLLFNTQIARRMSASVLPNSKQMWRLWEPIYLIADIATVTLLYMEKTATNGF